MSKVSIIKEYAKKNYTRMFREAGGLLRHKFIVPGSVYSDSLWDWDCWLTNVALAQFVEEDIEEYEQGCVLNFLENQDPNGRLPIKITSGGKAPGLDEPNANGHKPCLAQHAAFIIRKNGGDAEWLRADFGKLERYIEWYMANCRHKTGLYFWKDDCRIGVDNDPATFYRPDNSSASIYLNCFMYKELLAVCYIAEILGVDCAQYRTEAENLKNAIQSECYDEKDGFFYSADINLKEIDPNQYLHKGAPRHWESVIERIGCWSGFLAMWAGIATPEQAERMVRENLLDEKAYWANAGVRTLSKYEKMYSVKPTGNPSCWLGPIWGISNYFVFKALLDYGYTDLARELAEKTVNMFAADIEACGQMHEYYDPETGAPIINAGFQNWNLLSIIMGDWLDGKEIVSEF